MSKESEWKQIEIDIQDINKIVKTCPENVQEKCFELLFNLKFRGLPLPKKEENKGPQEPKKGDKPTETRYKLPGNVLAMLRKNSLSTKDLEKLFMLDHKPILPTYSIDSSKMATAQVQKVFMILLENALTSGQFKADYREIRDTCKEDGLFDSNFTTSLKKQHKYFRGAITEKNIDESQSVELTGPGYEKLAKIINQLVGLE